jgi:hypothetical protein
MLRALPQQCPVVAVAQRPQHLVLPRYKLVVVNQSHRTQATNEAFGIVVPTS